MSSPDAEAAPPSGTALPADARTAAVQALEAVLVIAAVSVIETALAAHWLSGGIDIAHALVLHAALVWVLCFWLYLRWRRGAELRHAGPLVVMTAVLGPVGAWGAFVTVALYALFRRNRGGFAEWYEALLGERARSKSLRLYDAIVSGAMDPGRDRSLASFVDLLALGTDAQRRALVAMVTENFRPAFAPILRQALQHRDSAVRVLAATAASRIAADAQKRTERLQAVLRNSPDDQAALRALGLHLKSQADASLVAPERATTLRRQALSSLLRYLERAGEDVEAIAAVANLHVGLGDHAAAREWLDQNPATRDSDASAFADYLDSLYRMRRFGELRERTRSASSGAVRGRLAPELGRAVALWQGVRGNVPAEAA